MKKTIITVAAASGLVLGALAVSGASFERVHLLQDGPPPAGGAGEVAGVEVMAPVPARVVVSASGIDAAAVQATAAVDTSAVTDRRAHRRNGKG